MKRDDLVLSGGNRSLQYTDDLLVASFSEEVVKHCLPSCNSGCEPKVTNLGCILENLSAVLPPHTKAMADGFFLRQHQLLPALNSQLNCTGVYT